MKAERGLIRSPNEANWIMKTRRRSSLCDRNEIKSRFYDAGTVMLHEKKANTMQNGFVLWLFLIFISWWVVDLLIILMLLKTKRERKRRSLRKKTELRQIPFSVAIKNAFAVARYWERLKLWELFVVLRHNLQLNLEKSLSAFCLHQRIIVAWRAFVFANFDFNSLRKVWVKFPAFIGQRFDEFVGIDLVLSSWTEWRAFRALFTAVGKGIKVVASFDHQARC